ncbi:MAG: TetR/AcrR family transcriptional regulator [Pseudomonadota bacterium]
MSKVSDRLLDAAEHRIRTAGFHAVSFRDLAGDLGIKSASVHYHFPKKEDLGVAVIDRYARAFFDGYAQRTEAGEEPVTVFVDLYRQALTSSETACLCGVMGAEALGLPEPVQERVRDFLRENIRVLAKALGRGDRPDPEIRATQSVAALQGAMMLAINLRDNAIFEAVAQRVERGM